MRCKALVLALTAASGVASAQPGPPPQPPPPPMDTTGAGTQPPDPGQPENPTPPPQPEPPQQPQPQQTMMVEPPPADNGDRPTGLSIGLGVGFSSPWDLEMPNISTARLRLASGLTFEPALRISNTTSDMDTPTGEDTDKLTAFALAALIRLPLLSRGRADLEALGTIGFANSKSNPEGDYNATTRNEFTLGYGVGIGYWLSPHWEISFSVTNPLVDYEQTKVQNGVPNMTTKSSDTTIGIIFTPDVFFMLHLYN